MAERRAWVRGLLDRFSMRWVPPHLRRTYPADLTLFLLNLALVVLYLADPRWTSRFLSLAMLLASALLFVGWWSDRRQFSLSGAQVATGAWIGQVAYLIAEGYRENTAQEYAFFLIVAIATGHLAFGVWYFVSPHRPVAASRGPA